MNIQHSSASATPVIVVAPGAVRGRKATAKWLVHSIAAGALCLGAQPALAITVYDITLIGLYDASHTSSSTGYQINEVRSLNNAGQVVGIARRYNGSTETGYSAWLYNGSTTQQIGLTGASHTNSSSGYQFNYAYYVNDAGQVLGHADRFNGSTGNGYSAWLHNGSTTQELGLTGGSHTRYDGYQSNRAGALNAAGQVMGHAERFNGVNGSTVGQSTWFYNGSTTQEIGIDLTGVYRRNQASALNAAGQVMGYGYRFNGSTYTGQIAWLYNGSTTQQIGLYDASHTRSDGYQFNWGFSLNDAGQVMGIAGRYNGSTYTGRSAWLYNGSTTQQIGLTDAGHTRSDGYQDNEARSLNAAGQVAGRAERFNGSTAKGQSAWLYNGSTTQEIGLTGASHTSSSGYQHNEAQVLNDAGQVAGYAQRFNGSTGTGQSAWLYNGSTTQEIGLTGGSNTRIDGYQASQVRFINAAGQVAGYAERYKNGSTATIGYGETATGGYSAWLFDPLTSQTYSMDASVSVLTGYAYSSISYLGDEGLALGFYTLFDAGGTSQGSRAFAFTVADGWNDLGSLVDGGLNDAGWNYLATAYRGNGASYIVGHGVLTGINGQAAYLMAPVPEPETWAMLLAGLGLVGAAAKRRKVSTNA